MPYIPFDELKQRASYEDAVEMLGLQLQTRGAQFRGRCPACKGEDKDSHRALAVTPGKGFYCWQSHVGGDQIDLVMHVLGISKNAAAQRLAEHVGMVTQRNSNTSSRNKNVPPKPESAAGEEGTKTFGPLSYLDPAHEAVGQLGIAAEDAERMGIGFAPKGILRGTVAVPIRTETGHLVGYIGLTEIAKLPKEWRFEEEPKNIVRFKPKSA
jgi:DNA primase